MPFYTLTAPGKTKALLTESLKKQNFFSCIFRKQIERIAFYGLIVTIFLTAIPYGTVDAWFKLLFVFLTCAFSACRVFADLLSGKFKISNFVLLRPLLGILLLAIFQVAPYADSVSFQSEKTISLDAFETKNFILVFAGLLVAGEVLLKYATTEKRLKVLIFTIVAIGIGSALFGLLRLVFPQIEDIIFSASLDQKVQFAQFVNRNHFALLMEMTLGLLTGLFLKADLPKHLKLLCLILIGVICFAIIWANSRGGIISAISLGLFAVFTHFLTTDRTLNKRSRILSFVPSAWRQKRAIKALLFTGLLLVFAIFTVTFVGGDSVISRLETIGSEVGANEDHKVRRLEIWETTLNLVKDYPITGVGFGAYPVAITRYDYSNGRFVLQQAHNDYLEILANGGVVAFTLMLVFLVILFKKTRAQFSSVSPLRRASCFGAVAGIVGVMIHSTVDFGLHVIVNALVFTILIVIATAQISVESEN